MSGTKLSINTLKSEGDIGESGILMIWEALEVKFGD